ncbi:MAG: DUF4384 domain-containing protein [Polyangiaceae bacterium]
MNRPILAASALTFLFGLSACPDPSAPVACAGEERVALDCETEVSYDGLAVKGGADLFGMVALEGEAEKRAIRDVSEAMQQFMAMHSRACRDYNACILDKEGYLRQSEEIRQRMAIVPAITDALGAAKTTRERLMLIDRLYRGVVPEDARADEVTFELGVQASLPEALGGKAFVVHPGDRVPSGTGMHFTVEVDKAAHLYLFQVTAKGEVTVLFPNPAISSANPLPAGVAQRIPQNGKRFRVNDEDLGTERVIFVVSKKPVAALEEASRRAVAGEITKVDDDPWLRSVASVVPADAGQSCDHRALELTDEPGCRDERALVLDDDPSPDHSLLVRPSPGDDVIVKVLQFEHVAEADYRP